MGLFDRFPSTKLNDINLDWILKVISKFKGGNAGQFLRKRSDANFDFYWSDSGGGGGGTSDYDELVNRPQINSVTLTGNKSSSDLGLLGSGALALYRTAAAQDVIDATKQAKITASGILKGDGDGGVSAATAGSDYLSPTPLMGGNAGQFLCKRTIANFDFYWADSGSGGTSNYNELSNQPKINNVTLIGNKTASDLGLLDTGALANFAYVNSGDTADKAYVVDELLVYKGQLYKASVAIAIGETLTPGSNITLMTVATALQNLHLKYTSLFDGSVAEYTSYTLSDSLANYDIVVAEIYTQDNERKAYILLPILNKKYDVSWNATDSVTWYIICTIQFTANTTLNVLKCTKRGFSQSNLQIYGIRIV